MTKNAPLAPDQLQALQTFAEQNGRNWKAQLSDLWLRAAADPILHALRNTHGPTWLHRYRLPAKV